MCIGNVSASIVTAYNAAGSLVGNKAKIHVVKTYGGVEVL